MIFYNLSFGKQSLLKKDFESSCEALDAPSVVPLPTLTAYGRGIYGGIGYRSPSYPLSMFASIYGK